MGAVLLSVSVSSHDRRQIQAQAALSSWAETIARENKTDAAYSSCVAPDLLHDRPRTPRPASRPGSPPRSCRSTTGTPRPARTSPPAPPRTPDSGACSSGCLSIAGLYPAFDLIAVGRGPKAVPRMLKPRRDEGFTLVELLITITVLGVIMVGLVAIMFGSMKANHETKAAAGRDPRPAVHRLLLRPGRIGRDQHPERVSRPAAAPGPRRSSSAGRRTTRRRSPRASPWSATSSAPRRVDGKPAGQLRRQACETAAAPGTHLPARRQEHPARGPEPGHHGADVRLHAGAVRRRRARRSRSLPPAEAATRPSSSSAPEGPLHDPQPPRRPPTTPGHRWSSRLMFVTGVGLVVTALLTYGMAARSRRPGSPARPPSRRPMPAAPCRRRSTTCATACTSTTARRRPAWPPGNRADLPSPHHRRQAHRP